MAACAVVVLPAMAFALDTSTGPNGANATVTGLTGLGIRIGQLETGRPGRPGFDNAQNSHPDVIPTQLFQSVFAPTANTATSAHAEQVAGIMISTNGTYTGISRQASLYSADSRAGQRQVGQPVATQRLNSQINASAALQNLLDVGNVRAVNMSFGIGPVGGNGVVNGQDFFTLATDWAARRFDTLPIVAGDETGNTLSVPLDNYNGIGVAMLRRDGAGVFRVVDNGNIFTTQQNNRRLIGLVAPGVAITSTTFAGRFTRDTFTDTNGDSRWNGVFFDNNGSGVGNGIDGPENWFENFSGTGAFNNAFNAADDWFFDDNFNGVRDGPANGDYWIAPNDPRFPTPPPNSEPVQDTDNNRIIDFRVNGTSFAAPHVNGAVALLQQRASGSAAAQHHEVMKAVLLNSADKRQDTGNGLLLGMQKTILRTDGRDWIQQYQAEGAVARTADPTDTQLGTGALNVNRAKLQLDAGKYNPGPVPMVGWNFKNISINNALDRYEISQPLVANSYVSITLDWDRVVGLTDTFTNANGGRTGSFDAETYIDSNGDGVFTAGEPLKDLNGNNTFDAGNADGFTLTGLNDLDLFFFRHGDPFNINNALALSFSARYSVEHIFFQVPADGLYDFYVRLTGVAGALDNQDYAVAWWSVPEPVGMLWIGAGLAALRRRRAHRSD